MSLEEEERRAWGGEVGPVLRDAREKLGLSLKEAERSTRIRASYLEGLEQENPAELPGKSYVQAFLRSYAEFLDLDAEEMSHRFRERSGWRRQQPRSRGSAVATSSEHRGHRGTLLMLSLAVLAIIFLVSALYMMGNAPRTVSNIFSGISSPAESGSGEREPEDASPGENGSGATSESGGDRNGAASSPQTANLDQESPASQSLTATIIVSGAESWISLESEDGIEYTGIAQPGFSRSFDVGGSFTITTGNAGAVELQINGQEYGRLGENGEVTARSFTLKGGGG